MRGRSIKVFVRVLVFGLLLGASSTAYADALAISSISFGNIVFTPASGTAVFTPTGASARATAMNTLGENQMILSNTIPVARQRQPSPSPAPRERQVRPTPPSTPAAQRT